MKTEQLNLASDKYVESKELVLMAYSPEYIDDVIRDMKAAFKAGAKLMMEELWISIKDRPLQREDGQVLGFNPEWIDEDFNPSGIRVGFLSEDGFTSATWNNEQDCFDTVYEEGDDYYKGNLFTLEQEKKNARPNMPTHYMFFPKHP